MLALLCRAEVGTLLSGSQKGAVQNLNLTWHAGPVFSSGTTSWGNVDDV